MTTERLLASVLIGMLLAAAAWAATGAAGGALAAWKVPDRKVVYDKQSCTGDYPEPERFTE